MITFSGPQDEVIREWNRRAEFVQSVVDLVMDKRRANE